MTASKYAIFAKAVELGSFTNAAKALGCTQSGVSHAINALEDELGLKLILRSRAGLRLTADGERILPAVKAVLAASKELEGTVAAIRGLELGCVRIGAFTSVAVHWLPGMIKSFEQLHPQIEFELLNGDYHDITQWFQDGSIDLGFVPLPSDISGCEFVPLMNDKLLAVLPQAHPLASLEKFPVSAIEGEDFISLRESSDHDARKVLKQAGVRPNIKFTTKDDYAIIAMVEQGLGMSIMPELLLKGRTENVRVMELETGMSRTIGLAIADTSKQSPCVESFAAHIKHWISRRYPTA